MLADQAAVLERHPVGFGELQVGDSLRSLQRHLPSPGVALLVERREFEKAVLPLQGDFRRRAVRAEEIIDAEFVERHQPRDQPGHLGMSRQRAVLGPRQRQPGVQFGKDCRGAGYRNRGQGQNRKRRIHATSANQYS